jgi:hypothetical protein
VCDEFESVDVVQKLLKHIAKVRIRITLVR